MECKSKEEYLITFAYPVCRDGYMHCEDEYAEGDYTGGEIPCSSCRPSEWMAYYRKEIINKGIWAAQVNHSLPLMIDCGVRGGFPHAILSDKKAMRTVRRWIRRGWNIGKKQIAQQRKAENQQQPKTEEACKRFNQWQQNATVTDGGRIRICRQSKPLSSLTSGRISRAFSSVS